MRHISTSICLALLLGAFPAAAQPVSALYQSVRDAGASPSDAARLIAAMSPAIQEAKINVSDGATEDNFGFSVSLDGDRALVGAWLGNHNGGPYDAGSAYIFVRTGGTWTQEAKLVANDARQLAAFGISVSLSGDRALVGADRAYATLFPPGSPPVSVPNGAAYVFVRVGDTWTQKAKLSAPYIADTGFVRFGASVSLDGDRALVGAVAEAGPSGGYRGAAYVFVLVGGQWTQEARLIATDSRWFGHSVSLSGDRALVGAPYDGQDESGSAFVYVRDGSTWLQEARLTASDAGASDQFGASVSLDSARALVGAPLDDNDGGTNSGSAYVFARAGSVWTQEAILTASDAAADHAFGVAVSLSGDRAAVGRDRYSIYPQHGSAYVFARASNVWTQKTILTPSDASSLAHFGSSVALDGNRVLVGAYSNPPYGSVYVFTDLVTVAAEPAVLSAVTLSAPYPNPATQRAALTLTLDQPQHVRAWVVDALGREVQLLVDAEATGGVRLNVNTAALAPGAYVVRVMGEAFAETRRLTIVR